VVLPIYARGVDAFGLLNNRAQIRFLRRPRLTCFALFQVCTTELGAFAKLEPEFTKRGVKLIGLSANTIDSHGGWIKDINEISQTSLKFPIIGDKERKVALAYDMYV